MNRAPAFPTGRDSHAKCATCGQTHHVYLFPFADPDAHAYPASPRAVAAEPSATHARRARKSAEAYAERVASAAAIRHAAQAKGRNTSKCLPCSSSEGSDC